MDSLYYTLCSEALDCAKLCVQISENAICAAASSRATEHLVSDMLRETQNLKGYLLEVVRRQSEACNRS